MPAIIITILTAFLSSLVAKVLLGAGLAFLSYTWVNDLVAQAQVQMMGLWGGLPAEILGVISILKIPQALSIIMSAIGTAAFIKTAKVAVGVKS